ncbi:MAG: DUF3800 domain-containing protein [Methylococcaceae bacterium]
MMNFNIYCDESCHLENDQQKAMVLGALWCSVEKRRAIAEDLRSIKQKHGFTADFEVKWTKVSQSKLAFYQEWIDYFFNQNDLHFRALVIPDKSLLNHQHFNHNHNDWYYKSYFNLLKVIFQPQARYNVYLDIKDTIGAEKVRKLHDVLCNNAYDFSRQIINRLQQVHSHEIEQLQLADLLIGALAYLHRDLTSNSAKLALIKQIQQHSGYDLTRNTLLREEKFNLLIWQGTRVDE